jgi:phage virion morphogenesis protein
MAGASIQIDIDDRQVTAVLGELIARGQDLEPAFREIGEYLDLVHRGRWDQQQAPDGTPWAPLNPAYQARKKRNADRILVLDGYLRDLLRYQASSDGLAFGTDRVYGATHQFGRPEAGIPARPFLGLSEEDGREVLEILARHLQGAPA